jgi:hypothetical protein
MWLASGALAQTNFPEVEPNSLKSEATPILGIVAGDTITGLSTGSTVTLGLTTDVTVDTFRVKTAALPAGIYQHRLTLTTSTTTGHTGTIRGLNQTGTVGVGGTPGTVDNTLQTALTTTTPPRFNLWYGFGKQEEIYYRVAGTTATTANYTATMSTTPVVPGVITQPFESANPITFETTGLTTIDTELLLYDSTFTAIPGGLNDDEFGGTTTQSRLTRTLAPGTYYLAVSTFELCTSIAAPADDDFVTGFMTDFPDCVVLSSTALSNDYDFRVIGSNGTWTQTNQLATGDPFRVTWWQFTTAPGVPLIAPPNNDCANAISVGTGGTLTGIVTGATADAASACDPGGAASRDVWYSYTNTNPSARILTATTCGTTGVNDTALAIYASCAGTELACNDDCGGTPCGGTTSCVSALVAASQTVLIRVSDKGLGGAGGFTLVTSVAGVPPPNDSCTSPAALAGTGSFAIDSFGATTGAQGQTEALCNYYGGSGIRQDLWYVWTATNSGPVTVSTCGLVGSGPSQDSKIAVYDGVGCPASAAIACNDDSTCSTSYLNATTTFNAVCGNTYTLQVGLYYLSSATLLGSFSVTAGGPGCTGTPSTPFCLGDGTGAPCPCGNNATSAGHGCATTGFPGGALLTASGTASDETIGTDTLVLTATNVAGPSLFIQSNGTAQINFGDGHLCAAVGIIRLGVVFPAGGVASYPGGLTPNEIHLQGLAVNGNVRHYQAWYRSTPALCNPGVQNFSLTQGLTLTWGP